MNTKNVIEINGLTKSYGDVRAVKDISFSVREGELFAFLGVNGAGKSTTINIISGQLERDGGNVSICGLNADRDGGEVKRRIGVVFQSSVLDLALSVRDNLVSRAALYGIFGAECDCRLAELSKMLDLSDIMRRPLGKLSGGQRRRIDIARALIHKPEILILDEPTTGLDPQTRKMIWSVIDGLRRDEHMTVFLTTHYMEEAAEADYVVIIDGGEIAAEGTPLELKNKYSADHITLYGVSSSDVISLGIDCETVPDGIRLSVGSTRDATELILSHPNLFVDYEITKGKMDDVFLAVTGKKLTGGDE